MTTGYVIMSEYNGYRNTFICGGQCFCFATARAANAFIDAVKISGRLRDGEIIYTCKVGMYGVEHELLGFTAYTSLSDSAINDMGIITLLCTYASAVSCLDDGYGERDLLCNRVLAEIKRKAGLHYA